MQFEIALSTRCPHSNPERTRGGRDHRAMCGSEFFVRARILKISVYILQVSPHMRLCVHLFAALENSRLHHLFWLESPVAGFPVFVTRPNLHLMHWVSKLSNVLGLCDIENLSTTVVSSLRHWLSLCRHCHIFATGFPVFDVQKSACWGTLCPILPKCFLKKIMVAGEVVADHCMECVDVQRIFEQKILLFHLRFGKNIFTNLGEITSFALSLSAWNSDVEVDVQGDVVRGDKHLAMKMRVTFFSKNTGVDVASYVLSHARAQRRSRVRGVQVLWAHCTAHVHLCVHSPVGYRGFLIFCKRNISITQKNCQGIAQKMMNYRSLQSHCSNSTRWEGRRRLYNSRLRVCHSCEKKKLLFSVHVLQVPTHMRLCGHLFAALENWRLHHFGPSSEKVPCEVFCPHPRRFQRIFDRLYTKPKTVQKKMKNELVLRTVQSEDWKTHHESSVVWVTRPPARIVNLLRTSRSCEKKK